MKHLNTFYVGLFAIVGFSLSACMTTTQLEVLQPAAFSIPQHIEDIATVNRALPSKKFGSFVEGLVTGENIGQDKSGRRRAIEGLSHTLTRTPRFKVTFSGLELQGASGDRFLPPLAWTTIDSICDAMGVDAVAALEKYDSDIHKSTRRREVKKKDDEGKQYVEYRYDVEMVTTVHLGWRLYDPKNRRIIDQFDVWENQDFRRTGDTEAQAINRLPRPMATVDETSYAAGMKYAMRIAPTWIEVGRPFYAKAKGDLQMEKAGRMAKAGDWEAAAGIWKSIIDRPATSDKIKGRAALNMAVANEVIGNLELAQDWAKIAYTDYGLGKARDYANLLIQRITDIDRLDEQLNP